MHYLHKYIRIPTMHMQHHRCCVPRAAQQHTRVSFELQNPFFTVKRAPACLIQACAHARAKSYRLVQVFTHSCRCRCNFALAIPHCTISEHSIHSTEYTAEHGTCSCPAGTFLDTAFIAPTCTVQLTLDGGTRKTALTFPTHNLSYEP